MWELLRAASRVFDGFDWGGRWCLCMTGEDGSGVIVWFWERVTEKPGLTMKVGKLFVAGWMVRCGIGIHLEH